MITYQHPFTVISPVDPAKLEYLRVLLDSIQQPDIESNTLVPFPKIRSVHFARFVLLECDVDRFPVQLVFSTDFDGDERAHIAELLSEAQAGLEQIYQCCEGFSGDLPAYWAAHQVPIQAFYNGHPGSSVAQIRQENALRQAIADYLNQAYQDGVVQQLQPGQVKKMVAAFIGQNSDFSWALRDKGLSSFQQFLFHRRALMAGIATAIGLLLLAGFTLVQVCKLLRIPLGLAVLAVIASVGGAALVGKRKLNRLENTDLIEDETPTPRHVGVLMDAENFQVQNQLSHLVEIKPGRFRRGLLKFVLKSINFLARTFFNKGELGSIPSIHFARWVMTDQDRRLLFFSNFDGSWENYLGDFVDKAAVGLTAVWSNTRNFPRSHNLIQAGARDEHQFKEWARHLQVSTQVWYSPYKKLSVQNINNNAHIRAGLFRQMDDAQAQAWLDRIFRHTS
jgi:hypothetical protein